MAAAAGIAGGWIAAGSTGLLSHPLRKGFTCAALACVVLAAWPKRKQALPFAVATAAAALLAVFLISSSLAPVNILAVVLVLVAATYGQVGAGRKSILFAAEAVALLALYRFALTAIPALWLSANSTGEALGSFAGTITQQPLWVGPTFAGLDFLIVMACLACRATLASSGLRAAAFGRLALALTVVGFGHLIYLNALIFGPILATQLPEPPPAGTAWEPYPPPPGLNAAVETCAQAFPADWKPAVRLAVSGAFQVALWLRPLIPWNLPAVAALIHAVIALVILRYLTSFPEETAESAPLAANRLLGPRNLAATPLAVIAAALLPVIATFCGQAPSLEGKKIVFNKKGFLNWLKPEYPPANEHRWSDRCYGRLAIGMYGMLPIYLENLGAETLISEELSKEDLAGADVLVLIFPSFKDEKEIVQPWKDGQLERIWEFVNRGGSLLVLGEHTIHEKPGSYRPSLPNLWRPPEGEEDIGDSRYGDNRFNDVLVPTAIRVPFDSAEFAVGGWLHSYESLSHPTTAGLTDDQNLFGVVIGASVEARWPAWPLLIGKWGWNDFGDTHSPTTGAAMMGDTKYNPGERLGDVVLVAEQQLGQGRVVVFGDTSSFTNNITMGCYPFTSRLFAYLATPGISTPQAPSRQALGFILVLVLGASLLVASRPERLAGAAIVLAASLTVCTAATYRQWTLFPDGSLHKPNNLAYIDASHLGAYSPELLRDDALMGLNHSLMRNGYLTLPLHTFSREQLLKPKEGADGEWECRARFLISIAPTMEYRPEERQVIKDFVQSGGIFLCMVGCDDAGPSRSLLSELGFMVGGERALASNGFALPQPLGHFKAPYFSGKDPTTGEEYQAFVRFHAAWPVECVDQTDSSRSLLLATHPPNLPLIVIRRLEREQSAEEKAAGKKTSSKGLVAVIGDTGFAMNQNLEVESGATFDYMRENIDFWRYFISLLREGVGDIPGQEMWFPPKPEPMMPPGAAPPVNPPPPEPPPAGQPAANPAPADQPPANPASAGEAPKPEEKPKAPEAAKPAGEAAAGPELQPAGPASPNPQGLSPASPDSKTPPAPK